MREGHTVGVVGESGSGKTTLGLALLRLISSNGDIQFRGEVIQGLQFKEIRPLRREMQVVFQDPYGSLSPRMSVSEIVAEGLQVHKIGADAAEREAMIVEALEEVGIDPASRHRYPARILRRPAPAGRDRPGHGPEAANSSCSTSRPRALDMSVQAQIVDLLRDLQDQATSLAYMFISHDLKVVRAMSHYIIVMKDGLVVEQGPAAEVFNNPNEAYTKALFDAAFHLQADETGVVRM